MDTDALRRFANEAGFIFRARVHADRSSYMPDLPPTAGEAITVHIEEIMRSTDVLRGLLGSDAILVTRQLQALKAHNPVILFTDCVSLGKQVLLREIGHAEVSSETVEAVRGAVREVEERPLGERIVTAELIVTGEVVASRVLERPFPPSSEHDPEWGIARITAEAVLKGRKPEGEVEVLFANSIDIAWYLSPKLHHGLKGIFLLHRLTESDLPSNVPRTLYQATHPLDFLPEDRRGEVERVISGRGR